MTSIRPFLVVAALVCFVIATLYPANPERDRLVSGGLALLALSMITW